ncbi:hypothetical protein AC578_1371 [Pseudocercospora eumusae]|uniref:Uncharacterized protein n=1 Tax=Pseudocercospora eumusae TaxID=321146 RepID=A0A139HUM7_9PEZI|nr:hypothetical protein AC578_1371 [Pseudocercospora eumusae]
MDPSSLDPAMRDILYNSDVANEARKFHQQHGRMPSMKEAQYSKAFRDAIDTFVEDVEQPVASSGYAYSQYPYSSAAPPPGCSDACDECSEHYRTGMSVAILPYAECLEDDEARLKVDDLRQETEENLSYLRLQLKTYGDAKMRPVDLLLNPQPEQPHTGCDAFETLAATGFAPATGAITQDVTLSSPFSAPPCLDMAEVVATLRSRLEACEEELWLFQTDTDYLREHLAKIGSSLAQEAFSGGSREELKLQVVMVNMTKVEGWQYLVHEAEQAMGTMSPLSSWVRSGHPLPQGYARIHRSSLLHATGGHLSPLRLCKGDQYHPLLGQAYRQVTDGEVLRESTTRQDRELHFSQ